MVRTRVGYAGGLKENPSYYGLGDHSETIQIDYAPTRISYQELLDVFWSSHNPQQRPWSTQYKSMILYHTDEQKRLAMETEHSKLESPQKQPLVEDKVANDSEVKEEVRGGV